MRTDWSRIAGEITAAHIVHVRDRTYTVDVTALMKSITEALQAASSFVIGPAPGEGPAPTPGRPVLVNDKWLEHLNNKLAQINQRLNELDGRTRQEEGKLRGMGEAVIRQDLRLQTIETTLRVADWAKRNLPEKTSE